MRYLIITILGIFTMIELSGQSAIKFKKNLSLKTLQAKAKAEKKIVFIDAFTTWCGPCKMMDRDVFTDKEVGQFYNKHFINAKIDMEKGEGPTIAQRYKVRGYPSFLFIDTNGEIVHRGIGYIKPDAFLALGQTAIGDNSIKALGAQYESRKEDPAYLQQYATTLVKLGETERATKVVDAYLAVKNDWNDDETMSLVISSPGALGGNKMNFIIANADKYISLVGSAEFINTTQRKFLLSQMQKLGKRTLPSKSEMSGLYEEHGGSLKDRLMMHYDLFAAEQRRDQEAHAAAAIKYYDAYPSNDSNELNSLAWRFYENVKDKAQLKKAIIWAQRSVELSKGYANLDTLAWLYYKTGQKEMAKETAKEAIAIAKATGQKYSETAKILY